MKIALSILFLIFNFNLFSQNYFDDVQLIINEIEKATSVTLNAKAKVLTKAGGSLLYSVDSKLVFSKTLGVFSQIGEQEYLKTKEKEIFVNHSEKEIFIHKIVEYSDDDFSKKTLKEIEQLLEKNDEVNYSISLSSNLKGIKTYKIKNVPGVKEMRIVLDMNKLSILKIEYFYSDTESSPGYYCVVEYTKFEYNSSVSESLFLLSNYYKKVDNLLVVSDKFKGYKLLQE